MDPRDDPTRARVELARHHRQRCGSCRRYVLGFSVMVMMNAPLRLMRCLSAPVHRGSRDGLSAACPTTVLACRQVLAGIRFCMGFGVLGPLEVYGASGVVAIGSRLQRRLLVALLVEAGTVVSADRLVDTVWAGQPPTDQRQALWTCVARLRHALAHLGGSEPDELLVTRPPGYLLVAGPEQIDASQFEHLVSAASQVGDDRPDAAADLLDRALGLWRGPAFQEFADEPFAEAEAARLEEMRMAATEDRFELDLVRGEHAALIAPLGAFAAAHPLRERPRSQLMLALHRSGRQVGGIGALSRLSGSARP